jgi:hypothetical protein
VHHQLNKIKEAFRFQRDPIDSADKVPNIFAAACSPCHLPWYKCSELSTLILSTWLKGLLMVSWIVNTDIIQYIGFIWRSDVQLVPTETRKTINRKPKVMCVVMCVGSEASFHHRFVFTKNTESSCFVLRLFSYL